MSDRNKAILSLIYKLIELDKKFDIREQKYLHDIAESLKLSSNEIKEVILNPDGFELVPPPSEQERMMILYYILFAMRIDGKILPTEEDMVYDIGIKLGFRETMLNDMIVVMKMHLHKRVDPEALISIIRKYHN